MSEKMINFKKSTYFVVFWTKFHFQWIFTYMFTKKKFFFIKKRQQSAHLLGEISFFLTFWYPPISLDGEVEKNDFLVPHPLSNKSKYSLLQPLCNKFFIFLSSLKTLSCIVRSCWFRRIWYSPQTLQISPRRIWYSPQIFREIDLNHRFRRT